MSSTRLALPSLSCSPRRRILSGLVGFWSSWSRSTISHGQNTAAAYGGRSGAAAPRERRHNGPVRVSAKADYAVRAVVELAAAADGPVKGERIAQAQEIPLKFLENIMIDLRHGGIVRSQRGAEGGYWLARAAGQSHV